MIIKFDKVRNPEFEKTVINIVNESLEPFFKNDFIPSNFKSLIICWEFDNYIEFFNKIHCKDYVKIETKIGAGFAKTLEYQLNDQKISEIIIDVNLFHNQTFFFTSIIAMILHEKSLSFITKKNIYRPSLNIEEGQDFHKSAEYLFSQWFPIYYSQNIINQHYEIEIEYNSSILYEYILDFKRKMKRCLYNVNSDNPNYENNFNYVYKEFITEIYFLIKLIINTGLSLNKLSAFRTNPELECVINIIEQIKLNHDYILKNRQIDLSKLKELTIKFALINEIEIKQERKGISIFCLKNPKLLYNKELVETYERIIGFVDILGFSEMITDYDKQNKTSTLLQDLNSTLKESIESTMVNSNQAKIIGLEYRIFSDNICLSVPFFDSEKDFEENFCLILIILRNFQFKMLSKNYLIRGGISIGSYYSNDYLIFSSGLVNAYKLESTIAIYPRIIIDEKIINKVKFPLNNILCSEILIYSKKESLFFINPFIDDNMDILKNEILTEFLENDLLKKPKEINNSIKSFIDFRNKYSNVKESQNQVISKILRFLQIEYERTVLNEKQFIYSYREKIRKRTEIKKNKPSSKIKWMIDFVDWYNQIPRSNSNYEIRNKL